MHRVHTELVPGTLLAADGLAAKDRTASYPKWRIAVRGVCDLLRSAPGNPRMVALDLLEAQEHFDPPDLSSRLKRIPGRGGGEFQISNIGAET
jgi:hypothetical protein